MSVAVRVFWQPCSTQYPPRRICSYKQPSPEISRPVYLTLGQGRDGCCGPLWQPFLPVPFMPGSPPSQTQHWADCVRLHNFHFPRAAGIGPVAARVFWLDGHPRTNSATPFEVLSLFSRKSGLPDSLSGQRHFEESGF